MALGRREGSNISGCHYLDGIPVKISEKFKPPRKITLPLSYQQHYPVNLLNEEYDFSLENQVLELAMTKRRGREVAERAKTDKLGDSIEQFTRMASSDHKGSNSWEKKDDDCTKTYPGTNKTNGDGSYPPNDPNGNSNTQLSGDSSNGPAVGIATSLLTSLEPNSMLKPVPSSTEPPAVSDKPDVTLTSKFNLEDFEAESSPFDSVALKTLNDIEELKSVLQNAHLSESGNGNGVQQTEHDEQAGRVKEFTRGSRFSRHGDEHHALRSFASDTQSIPSTQIDNHFSVGKDSETTVDDHKKSCTRPSSHKTELDAEAQQLIGHITDMGFPRAKVGMVVQHVGKDDKKVVEHLCLMQTFIERGYIADDVESGVLFYGNNETQVKEYLETMIQFRDLGFDNESINKALVRCEHDCEKALNLLLS